ncbi:MAG: S24 family peptidase [Legionellaceae bacterium]|nr:S24 family peptidase [Legionellaceae bacterium]
MVKPSSFCERLNLSLDKEGFPPKNKGRIRLLSEMVGLTHRGASKWVNGQSSPPARKYPQLAKQLNVNEAWLKSGIGSMYQDNHTLSLSDEMGIAQDVPIYSMDQMLLPNKTPQNTIRCILPYRGLFYGLRLKTEAMAPRFPSGSIIIFDKYTSPKDGDFVLVQVNGYPDPVFRQMLVSDSSTIYLNAYNPKFDRLILEHPHDMMGKLVQAIVSF